MGPFTVNLGLGPWLPGNQRKPEVGGVRGGECVCLSFSTLRVGAWPKALEQDLPRPLGSRPPSKGAMPTSAARRKV